MGEEYQRIQDLWENSNLQEKFDLRYYPALRGVALQEKVFKFKPNLIHFSGHGEADSIMLTDLAGDKIHEVSKTALAELFRLCAPDLKAVFLNACYSAKQADDMIEQVDYVIGMNAAVNDLAAISFSQGFYSALFSQETLDIHKAFAVGCNQMNIAHISEVERKKPTLLQHRYSFVSCCRYDVFISFSDEDTQWANELVSYLHKQLKLKLVTADGFQLYTGNDLNQLTQSAILLIITSPAYYQQYRTELEQIGAQAKQQPLFLIDYEACKRPECLKGALNQYRFWSNEDLTPLIGEDYFEKANELATILAKRLKELKEQYQHQQITQHRKQQKITKDQPKRNIDAFVFLNSAPENLDLTRDIVPLLEDYGIDYILPLTRSIELSASDIRQDIENNILNCDAVLMLYEQTTPIWIREQLGTCRRLQRKRETPLKIIAVYKDPDKPDVGLTLEHLYIYNATSKQVSEFMSEFIEELIDE